MNSVQITVTDKIAELWPIVPYSHDLGCENAIYGVPSYEVVVNGSKELFQAVRFGLVHRDSTGALLARRRCDAGLSARHETTPGWIPTYDLHSADLRMAPGYRQGAWQLLPHKGFLIHQGSPYKPTKRRPSVPIAGSLGCIEIVGEGFWGKFLSEIERIGGADSGQIGMAKCLQVTIQPTEYPIATLWEILFP